MYSHHASLDDPTDWRREKWWAFLRCMSQLESSLNLYNWWWEPCEEKAGPEKRWAVLDPKQMAQTRTQARSQRECRLHEFTAASERLDHMPWIYDDLCSVAYPGSPETETGRKKIKKLIYRYNSKLLINGITSIQHSHKWLLLVWYRMQDWLWQPRYILQLYQLLHSLCHIYIFLGIMCLDFGALFFLLTIFRTVYDWLFNIQK